MTEQISQDNKKTKTQDFEVWYLKNGTTIGQIHGDLLVADDSLSLKDEKGSEIFKVKSESIVAIRNDHDTVTIQTQNSSYVILVVNRVKTAERMALLGVLGTGGKSRSGFGSSAVQAKAEELADGLNKHGYKVTFAPAKMNKNQILIISIVSIVLAALIAVAILFVINNPATNQ